MNTVSPSDAILSPEAPRHVRIFDRYFFARPVLMPPVWTILLLSAAEVAATPAVFSARVWAGLALCFFLYGGVYVFNQIFDIESDRLNNKLYFLPGGIITVRSAYLQYLFFVAIAVGGGWFLGRIWFFSTVAVVILGVFYSLPPVRLKDGPLRGLLANAVGHGTLVYYLGQALARPDAGPEWGASSSYALAVAGVYLLTTIPDREGDKASGKRTLSVRFGPRATSCTALVCVLAAGIIGVLNSQWPVAVSAGISLPFFTAAIFADSFSGQAVRAALLSLSFFACLAFWPYLLMIVFLYVSTRWYYRRRFRVLYPQVTVSGGG